MPVVGASKASNRESPMSSQPYDLLGLGNAIVDVIARAEEDFLIRHGLRKGAMTLIDEPTADRLYDAMGPATIVSGGSAANTAVGVVELGARAAFIGKIKEDEIGRIFAHDLRATGVHFATAAAAEGAATARSFIFVTPDGERTMNTYLGACQNLGPDDVDEASVRAASILYLEGYLWDPPAAKEAFVKASRIAHAAGRRVALSLSDAFCVDRYRSEFLHLLRSRLVDIVLANESELKSLYTTGDVDSAVEALRQEDVLAVVTRAQHGSLVVTRGQTLAVPAHPIDTLVDTTGAGDLFAAGFLAGLARGADHTACARLGALAAAEIIQHIGARPLTGLRDLAEQSGLALA
jgi:sugar/nucleoside kinase (ribokinase family)